MKFSPKTDIPSLEGKIVLVTGGTDGLGKETIRELSLHCPTHIYLAGRNRTKAEKVLEEFHEQHPDHAPITFLEMDMADLASVRRAADTFLAENSRLDILVCNAGISGSPAQSKDGYELAFGCNYLGHALLVQLLLPTLQSTTKQSASAVRVVILSSMAERFAPKQYTFDKMKTDLSNLGMMARYGQSKLACIHLAASLAKRYPEILFTSVHPGQVRTNFSVEMFKGRPIFEFLCRLILPLFMKVDDVDEGAKGQLWCATGDVKTIENGAYYVPFAVTGKGTARTKDITMAEDLWDWTQIQLKPYL